LALCLTFTLPNATFAGDIDDDDYDIDMKPPTTTVIIAQPSDVVECVNSTDKFLFVVAAPLNREYKVVYRWWKDGRVYSNWKEDFGQINFDTLEYNMSGLYQAEMFAFDPEWESMYGNSFNYDSARKSPTVWSEKANLYVLQRPEFMSDIPSATAAIGSDLTFTIDAHTYGEHNMENPSYWTQIDWFKGDVELENNERIAGADASIMTLENVMADDYATDYRVRLVGECDTVWSNNFAISAEPVVTVTVQPISVSGCVDEVVQFTVEAVSTVDDIDLMYQWMVDGAPIANEAGKFAGANTANLNVTLTTDHGYNGTEEFTCAIYPEGYPANVTTTDAHTITWKTAPMITTDLNANYSVEEEQAITMTIAADGENLTYTWMKDGNDLNNNMDSYEIASATTDDAGEYMVTITNDCGEVMTTTAILEVTPKTVATSVTADNGLGLEQNYPNPVVGNSTIRFTSEISGQATLTMTDMMGNTVANIYSNIVTANETVVATINSNEMNLTSGSYFVTLRIGDRVETIQVSVIK
jgi:hypothetical protein